MPDLTNLALFVAAAFVLAITPGPGIFYVAARTLAGGRAEGLASSFGTGLGGMFHVVAGSLGISALLLASATLFSALKLIGAGYLVWLGLRIIRSASQTMPNGLGEFSATKPAGGLRALHEGVLVETLNPKTAAFFLAFIPQFVDPAAGQAGLQFLVLGAISVALNTLADVAVVFIAGAVRNGAARRPALITRFQQGSGLAMIALGIGLALVRRPAQ